MNARPFKGLGKLEILYEKLNKIHTEAENYGLLIFAADNGISHENCSIYPAMSSAEIVYSHLEGKSPTVKLLQRLNKNELIVDVGLARQISHPEILERNVCMGSRNFLHSDALEQIEARQAIEIGRSLWDENYISNFDIIGIGEIGVGNTVCAAALASVLTGVEIAEMVGRGSASAKVIDKKVDIISKARTVRCPSKDNVLDLLARFGGLEIAALTGFISRAPEKNRAIMLDGYVTAVAALLASKIDEEVPAFLITPSLSVEPGHHIVLEHLGQEAIFDLDINHGEGLAALIGLFFAEMAMRFLA
ncbi:MAG: nicotinate-nucleotide--dimethylbenzimidazole phosphoribosyltransferase [Syntrophomonadaceae bacterium]|nr:nicotinate-nucleotide--dimethylbenzimidazole phosphoribosyltransferase [Syntrophomonadaceae bacterium]